VRKKRRAPTFAQKISCAFCGKSAKKTNSRQRFCSDECRISNSQVKNIERSCEVCNTTFFVSNEWSSKRSCSKFCGDVINAVEKQKLTDEEIIHLVLLNAGYGISRFGEKIGVGLHNSGRLHWIRDTYLESNGIDLYKILNDSTTLIEMKRDEWMANGRPPRVMNSGTYGHTSSRIKRSQILKRLELAKARGGKEDRQQRRTHLKVRVYPEFNWGPYEPR